MLRGNGGEGRQKERERERVLGWLGEKKRGQEGTKRGRKRGILGGIGSTQHTRSLRTLRSIARSSGRMLERGRRGRERDRRGIERGRRWQERDRGGEGNMRLRQMT